MKPKTTLYGLAMAVVLQLGMLAGSAQTNMYLFSGSETNITLPPGTYIITTYGAAGGWAINLYNYPNQSAAGGFGAEMSAEFNFSTSATLTLLVGGIGGSVIGYDGMNYYGGGGGGGSFVVEGSTPLIIAGGGGGAAVSGLPAPGAVKGFIGSTYTDGYGGGPGYPAGGAGGTNGGGGDGGGYYGGGLGGGGGGGFYGDGGYGYGSGGGSPGLSFEYGGGAGGMASYYGGDYSGGYGGGFGGGGSGSYNFGDGFFEFGLGGGGGGYSGGGGGVGGSVGYSSNTLGGGGGGGSIIDSSAIAILAEISPILSPDAPYNGEIIITAVPTPLVITTHAAFGFTNGVFGFNAIGPSGSHVVIEASTDLQTWIPLQTNLLSSGPLYFSDAQSTTNARRFYRAQLSRAFTVGGTLTGLPAGDTVTLQDNGGDDLTLSTNGTFTFPKALPNGQSYSVTVSGTSGGTEIDWPVTANCSGIISGTNVTNVAVQCTPLYTGNLGLDMYNAAVADGTANGGVPAVMFTDDGGPFRVTAASPYSYIVALHYSGYQGGCKLIIIKTTTSCSSTTLPIGPAIQFGTALECGGDTYYGY